MTEPDPIRDFFRRYHAVPATDAGPDWPTATVDALLGWFNGECDLLRRGTGDPARTILKAVVVEVWARVGRLYGECAKNGPDWPGRHDVGRLLAAVAANADVLRLGIA